MQEGGIRTGRRHHKLPACDDHREPSIKIVRSILNVTKSSAVTVFIICKPVCDMVISFNEHTDRMYSCHDDRTYFNR